MNRKISKIAPIGLAVLIAVSLSFSGCIGGDNNAKEGMKEVPEGTLFACYDLEAMKDDKDLAPIYNKYYEDIELSEHIRGDVKWAALGGNLMSPATIISGNFDIGEIENALECDGFYKDTYDGEEVWVKEEGAGWFTKSKWIVLHKDKLLGGHENGVKLFMGVASGDGRSMYDNEDCRDVVDRAGGGFLTMVMKSGSGILGALPAGEIAEATSMKKIDSKTIGMTVVIKYEDKDAAKSAEDQVRESYEDWREEVEIKVDREYITVTRKYSIGEVLSEL